MNHTNNDYNYFIGVDTSKKWIDFALLPKATYKTNSKLATIRVDNNEEGFKKLFKWLKKAGIKEWSQVLMVIEQTGVYTLKLCRFLELNYSTMYYTLVPAAYIGKAGATKINRTKTDADDAIKAANYAYRFADAIPIQRVPVNDILKLRALWAQQRNLKKSMHKLLVSTKELKEFTQEEIFQCVAEQNKPLIKMLREARQRTIKQMLKVIKSNEQMKQNYELMQSIKGIGVLTATYLIICTHNFTRFDNARQLAAYAGIAPFPKQSGTSVNGNTKVSHMADKELKTLLSCGSRSAIRHSVEFSKHYHSRLREHEKKKADGKPAKDGRVINIIRNKLLHRVFAVVKRGTPYLDMHSYTQLKKEKRTKKIK